MLDARWCEKHLAGDEGMSAARLHKPTGAGGDHLNLIARMRLLAVHLARLVDFDEERAVAKALDELLAAAGEGLKGISWRQPLITS